MAYGQNLYGPNMYGTYGAPIPNYNVNNSVDQLYNTYKQMQSQMQANTQPTVNVNPSMGQRGIFIQISDYKEVENYHVPTDGTPTLFFDFVHYVFYSKKFANGQCSIQSFVFSPMNGNGTNGTESDVKNTENKQTDNEETQNTNVNSTDETLNIILEKLDETNKKVASLDRKVNKLQSKSKTTKVEEDIDELD
jgi:outer membrane murein-binding lipoprotein Lpp